MKLSHSFKAFIISFLVTGNLALLLWGYQISNGVATTQEQEYNIEYNQEVLEELLAQQELDTDNKPIETHRAFNQSQEAIAKSWTASQEDQDDFQERLAALDNSINQVKNDQENRVDTESTFTPTSADQKDNTNNANSTNAYRLVDRDDLYFPTPIYTCEAPGTVVVNITVDANGQVIAQAINQTATNTTNECLWDMALTYAAKSLFSKSSRASQLGTITYRFPGQH